MTMRRKGPAAFTLIEVLAVLAILAILAAILLPALQRGRVQARILRAHSDLRQIGIALEAYATDFSGHVPPTRSGCNSNVQFQLPVELAVCKYLPPPPGRVPQADFPDVFNPHQSYKYRAPGPIWLNGAYFDAPRSTSLPRAFLWVPSDYPRCESSDGVYYYNRLHEPKCPVLYALWSLGPDPESEKLPRNSAGYLDEVKLPLPRQYWLTQGPSDTGLITHFRSRQGGMHTSP